MRKQYLLKNVQIIDVEKGSIGSGSLEIAEGRIQNIYREADKVPSHSEEMDIERKYVLPGLIDMHCHLTELFAPQFVASGVTTVRNTAGNVLQLKSLIEAPSKAPTPRIYSADRMIDGPPGLWGPDSPGSFNAYPPDAARKEVQRQIAACADFIKVYGWLKKDVLAEVVEEAALHNREVSCDLLHSFDLNALDAANIGVKWFEHASGFLQVLYPNWNTRNKISESIAGVSHLNTQWENMTEHQAALKKQLGQILAFTKKVSKIYFDMGGTVVTGTDTPAGIYTYPGAALHRELELFVEIGFSEMEALQAATIKAAQSIGLMDRGVIKKGMLADLIILSQNPLIDITNTQSIELVIKGGEIYTQDEVLAHVPNPSDALERYERFVEEFEEIVSPL